MSDHWQAYAIRYGSRNNRTRGESFIFDDHPAAQHGIDYFVWVLINGPRTILIDTGYDAKEAGRRGRPIERDPAKAIEAVGISAEQIDTVIITHLHYDHAGGLDRYPNARFYVQESELAYATGPCMCHPTLQMPYTADHVCDMVRHIYSGRVEFVDGAMQVAPGVRVHRIGGHARGLQVVEVETADGPLCIASDATHYYENFLRGKPFPIIVDVEDTLKGFKTLIKLAGTYDRVIPGHDPLIASYFPLCDNTDFVWRLDKGPKTPISR